MEGSGSQAWSGELNLDSPISRASVLTTGLNMLSRCVSNSLVTVEEVSGFLKEVL